MSEPQEEKPASALSLAFGTLCRAAASYGIYYFLTSFESGEMESIRMPAVAILVYELLGKWAVVGLGLAFTAFMALATVVTVLRGKPDETPLVGETAPEHDAV